MSLGGIKGMSKRGPPGPPGPFPGWFSFPSPARATAPASSATVAMAISRRFMGGSPLGLGSFLVLAPVEAHQVRLLFERHGVPGVVEPLLQLGALLVGDRSFVVSRRRFLRAHRHRTEQSRDHQKAHLCHSFPAPFN